MGNVIDVKLSLDCREKEKQSQQAREGPQDEPLGRRQQSRDAGKRRSSTRDTHKSSLSGAGVRARTEKSLAQTDQKLQVIEVNRKCAHTLEVNRKCAHTLEVNRKCAHTLEVNRKCAHTLEVNRKCVRTLEVNRKCVRTLEVNRKCVRTLEVNRKCVYYSAP